MERKKRKKNIGKTILLLLILALVAFALLCVVFVYSDVKGKLRGADAVTVTVDAGMGPLAIGKVLEENGVIHSAQLFRLYIKFVGEGPNLQYGDFDLSTDMSYEQIVTELKTVKKQRDSVRVTFPEGSTVMQFAQKMEAAGLCTAKEFIETANTGDFSQFAFWNKIGSNPLRFMKAEGYLFPDTYDFFKDDTVYNMVAKLYDHFNAKLTDADYAQMQALGMTLDEFITLASFVQEEAGHAADQPHVAAVLHNRLKPNSPWPRLECNVSSYIREPGNYVNDYIIPYYGGIEYIPQGMFDAYDTYHMNGLPAGPISCPGADAIQNTLHPKCPDGEVCKHYFFVTDLTGKYYYSATYEEHAANVAKANKVNASMGK